MTRHSRVVTKAQQVLANAKEQLRELQQSATDQVEAASKNTDEYVHTHPWQVIGIAAGLAAITSMVVSLLLSRR
jgi:ElaB/YqjD/DUF883 family membrane-anchored ribosome-binding protein